MNPWSGLKGLPRSVWIVFSATLISRAGTMVLPFLVLYMTRSLGFTAERAGMSLAVYGAGALITGPLSGKLCDRIGGLKVLEASLLLSGVLVMALPLLESYGAILCLVFVWAIIGEASRPASLMVVTELVAPAQRKTAVALVRQAINLGMSVGPAAGGFLAMVSFPALFVVDGTTTIIAGLVLAASRRKKRAVAARHAVDGSTDERPAGRPPHANLLADRRLVYFMICLIPVLMVFFQGQAALPLHLVNHLGMPEVAYGLLFTLNTLMIILIEVPLSGATAHWPHRLSMSLGALLTGAGFGGMALAHGYPGVVLTVIVWTVGEMILLPTATTYVAEISPPRRRGQYMGVYTMTFSIAFTLGPWLGTAVMDRFGPTTLWVCALGFGCLSAAMMTRLYPRRKTDW
jgi:predicted MFS family arabinose efflux permease